MASASNLAIDSDLIRLDFLVSSESGIEFVTTTSFNNDASMRATAPPDKTACVAQAVTLARALLPITLQRLSPACLPYR